MKRGFPWDFALVELHAKGVHQNLTFLLLIIEIEDLI